MDKSEDHFSLKLHSALKRSVSIEVYNCLAKVILLGDSGVGKTCFLHQFMDSKFHGPAFESTIGLDYHSKVVNVDNQKIKFKVWDSAGQEKFRSITNAYYRDADALFLLYDVTNKQSFVNLRSWITEIHEFGSEDAFIVLLGNKTDITEEREVRQEEGSRLAQENDIVCFMECSAKTGLNIDLTFQIVGRKLLSKQTADLTCTRTASSRLRTESTRPSNKTCSECYC